MNTSRDFLALVETLYFTANIKLGSYGNWNEYYDARLKRVLEGLRQKVLDLEEVFLVKGIEFTTGVRRYPYCFLVYDDFKMIQEYPKYQIYFAKKVGDNYPILVKVSSQWLHISGLSLRNVIKDIESILDKIFRELDRDVWYKGFNVKLNRFDICNHNTKVNLKNYINERYLNARVVTRLKKVKVIYELVGEWDVTKDYIAYGNGDIVIRFYNKIKEVCQMRYKQFFIEYWKQKGLIDEKTYNIYKITYEQNKDYELDFLYAHLLYESTKCEKSKIKQIEDMIKLYNNDSISIQDRYEELKNFIKNNNIELVKEIMNVEYQVRAGFLKTIKIINKETGQSINYEDIYDIFNNIDLIYNYLTTNTFRVVNPFYYKNGKKYRYNRKRDARTDSIWQEIQKCKVENKEDFKIENLELIRNYVRRTSKEDIMKKLLSNLASIYYLNHDVDLDNIDEIDLNDIVKELKTEMYSDSENYFNFIYKLEKKIKRSRKK